GRTLSKRWRSWPHRREPPPGPGRYPPDRCKLLGPLDAPLGVAPQDAPSPVWRNCSSLWLRSATISTSKFQRVVMVVRHGRPAHQVRALREDLREARYTVDHLTELLGEEASAAMGREQVIPALRRARTLTDPAAVLARLLILGDD